MGGMIPRTANIFKDPLHALFDPLGLTVKPTIPTPPTAPGPAPTFDNSAVATNAAARAAAIGARGGMTSTMLTGGTGTDSMGTTSKTLLGQ